MGALNSLKRRRTRENDHCIERHYGEFPRSFSVPLYVDAVRINAEFKDGVLTITLPKNEEARPSRSM